MHPAILVGRWILAFCIAAVVWLIASFGAFVAFRLLFSIPATSVSGFATGFCIGTFFAVWAGASTLPLEHRKTFSLVLFAILGAFVAFQIFADATNGTFGRREILIAIGSVLGARWTIRRLWPRWGFSRTASPPDEPVAPRAVVQPPQIVAPVIRAASPVRRPVGPPAFGRRR